MSLARARQRMSGLGLGLEDDEVVAPGEGEGAVPVANPEAEETVEQGALEVTEAAGEVEQQEEAAEQLEEAAATMESIYQSLQASLENGGMSADAAVYLNHAVTATLRSVGVRNTKLPSLESYGGATGRLTATKLSMESVADWLKSLWTAIKNAVIKAIAWVKDFFAKLFGGAEKLIKRVEELEKEAAKMKSEKPESKIQFRSVSKLHTTGKADAKAFQDGLDVTKDVIATAYTSLPAISKEMNGIYADKMGKLAKAKGKEDQNKIYAESQAAVGSALSKEAGAAEKLSKAGVMAGGVTVHSEKPSAEKSETMAMSLRPIQKFAQIEESQEMDALDSGAVKAMLATVKAIATSIKEKKSTIEQMEKDRKDAVDTYEKAVKDIEKGGPNFVDRAIVGWYMRGIRKNYAGFLTTLSSHGFSAARAALVLCEKSIAAYGTDDKK